jgi:glutathione S-transferase
MLAHPILWTFRRCPYAMRARLALSSARVTVELREILLKKKPQAFLETSPSASVPSLWVPGLWLPGVEEPQQVIDESIDIMVWALEQNDPEQLLNMPSEGSSLIDTNDGPFKIALDHTKYASRFPDVDAEAERHKAAGFLVDLDQRLKGQAALFGDRPTLADQAILPFVRQFANADRDWFDAQDWPDLSGWLNGFTQGDAFARIMIKYALWQDGDAPVWFGGRDSA